MTADSPLFSGTILGLRAWTVRIGLPSSTTRLEALVTEADWEPGGAWTRARCGVPEHLHDGPAPQPGCSCGLYAWHPRPGPARRLFTDNVASVEDDHAMAPVDFSVFGVVEAAGVIEVHQRGFRAERARPVAFVAGADWGEGLRAGLDELAGIYGVEVISARDWRDVVAACEELGGVLSEARVDELLEPVMPKAEPDPPKPRPTSGPAPAAPSVSAGPSSRNWRELPGRIAELVFMGVFGLFAFAFYASMAAFAVMIAGGILFGWLDTEPEKTPVSVTRVMIDRERCRGGVELKASRQVDELRVRFAARVETGEGIGHDERRLRAVPAGRSVHWVTKLPKQLCRSDLAFRLRARALWAGRFGPVAIAESGQFPPDVRKPAEGATF